MPADPSGNWGAERARLLALPLPTLATPTAAERLAYVASCYPADRAGLGAAQTLGITIATTPLDERADLLAAALALVGVCPRDYARRLEPADGGTGVTPLDAFMQLHDRERTYLSNIPAHTPMARLCRHLIRRGLLSHIHPRLTAADLRTLLDSADRTCRDRTTGRDDEVPSPGGR